jgi:hypothetical protein
MRRQLRSSFGRHQHVPIRIAEKSTAGIGTARSIVVVQSQHADGDRNTGGNGGANFTASQAGGAGSSSSAAPGSNGTGDSNGASGAGGGAGASRIVIWSRPGQDATRQASTSRARQNQRTSPAAPSPLGPPAPPPPIVSIVLVLDQSDGTVQEVPEMI